MENVLFLFLRTIRAIFIIEKKGEFICMSCLYLAVNILKEVVLLEHYVLKGDWYPATIKFFHSRNIFRRLLKNI